MKKEIVPFNLGLSIGKKDLAGTFLKAGDAVKIYSLAEIKGETQFVTILGQIKKPGRYELFENNMTIYDLLFKSRWI